MIEETATVSSVENGFAWVETQRKSVCGSCAVNKGCGSAVIGKVLGNKRSRVKVLNGINAKLGDSIVIGIEEQALVKGSFALYLVPLLAMLMGAVSGAAFTTIINIEYSEGLRILFSFLGLGCGFVWVKTFSKKISNSRQYQPVALRFNETAVTFYCPKNQGSV